MTFTFDVNPAWNDRIPEVVHEDGTARAQVVTRETNPKYYELIQHLETLRGNAVVLAPSGRIDESTVDAFRERLLAEIEASPAIAIIDLAQVAYMSSRGLRALTLAQRAGQEAGTTIVLARPNETMREILAISRYDMVFRVAATIEDAIGH